MELECRKGANEVTTVHDVFDKRRRVETGVFQAVRGRRKEKRTMAKKKDRLKWERIWPCLL